MFKTTSSLALMAVVALTVGACTESSTVFDSEAGRSLDEGGFGNPTMTNTLISKGALSPIESLGLRFSSEVPDMVNFDFNSARLDAQARAALMQQANWIRQFPEVRFRVYGHTDLVGSDASNQALGLRRAKAVVAFLTAQGISRSRLEAVASYGETRPVVSTPNRERRNRRTVTEVRGFVGGKAIPLNGKYAALVFREYVQTAKSQETLARERVVQ